MWLQGFMHDFVKSGYLSWELVRITNGSRHTGIPMGTVWQDIQAFQPRSTFNFFGGLGGVVELMSR